ncbi:MAG TPA: alkaline phosphatase D family protein [Streptosporangiaceae bacterium]|nr:alkaline phosphatase D family protein [Streptosporangiaceae bacterium]
MPDLVLGPLLRYVDERTAAVWVQTDAPCTVRVLDSSTSTFTVHGHHFALVEIEGLRPGTSTPYTVDLDGRRVWPAPGDEFPPSRISTVDPGSRHVKILFGSCRTSVPNDAKHVLTHGVDVLRSYAYRIAGEPQDEWPTLLLLLGDQVYADETPEPVREFIRGRRDTAQAPGEEIADFAEYAELYRLAWSDPAVRWLMSTIPTAMIFDDHDLRDDWNTSATWQRQMRRLPWWRRRVVAGLGSYWIYQHLGNLPPAERAVDPLLGKLRGLEGDGGGLLDEFAWGADQRPQENRWSFTRDFGATRLVVLDSRCARALEPGRRAMMDDLEWEWFDGLATGDVDHLVIGSSLPILLPVGLHYLESWNEAVCDGAWGARAAAVSEKIRQGIDLEHWGAFRRSFTAMSHLIGDIAAGRRGRPPATITMLSGDVHYSYLARARTGQDTGVYQIVSSPIRNPLSRTVRVGNGVASFALAGLVGRGLAKLAGVPRTPFRWRVERGPWFHNTVATLNLNREAATVRWYAARSTDGDPGALNLLGEEELS